MNRVFDTEQYSKVAEDVSANLNPRTKPTLVDVLKTVTDKLVDQEPYIKLAVNFEALEVSEE